MIDWEVTLKKIIQLYNDSPFGKRSGSLVTFIDLLIKLMGMNTDHCSKEKKDAQLFEELKAWAVNQNLGEEVMLEMSMDEITQLFHRAESDCKGNSPFTPSYLLVFFLFCFPYI